MTDLELLRKELVKTSKKSIIIGLFIFMFGIFIVWLIVSEADPEMRDWGTAGMVAIWLLAGLFLFIGGLLVIKPMLTRMKVNNGTHPLLNAIETKDHTYVLWVYEHISRSRGGVYSQHAIHIRTRDRKLIAILAKQSRVHELINMMMVYFPNAEYGYSKEKAKEYQRKID